MSKISRGTEVRFFKWDGSSSHDVFRALIRNIDGDADGHPQVDLSYMDGTPTNQNAVENEEFYLTGGDLDGEDYWKHAFWSTSFVGDSKPYDNLNPDIGGVVWYFRYNVAQDEHFKHPAIIRTKGGAPRPDIGLFYILLAGGTRQNVNNVSPFSDQTFPSSESYWVKRRLQIGEA